LLTECGVIAPSGYSMGFYYDKSLSLPYVLEHYNIASLLPLIENVITALGLK
jgi:hypothetical protein